MNSFFSKFSFLSRCSLFFLVFLIVLSFFFPLVSSVDPNAFDPLYVSDPESPSLLHPFGTDDLGRDLMVRLIYGAKVSLLVAFASVFISVSLGVFLGLISGYFGSFIDFILMRILDFFMAIPTLFLLLIIQVLLKPSIWNVVIVIGLTSWMGVARLVRAEVKSVKERPFVLAARSRGFSHMRLLFGHILPHTWMPVLVAATLGVGDAILTESMLSFLGLGVQPPYASWGNMLDNSLSFMREAPWMALFPGLLITLTVLSLNFISDQLRSVLDVKGGS